MFEHDVIIIDDEDVMGQRTWGWPPRRVVIPEFEIYANPTVHIGDIKRRRFNLIDRYVQKAKQQLMAQEDEDIFKALDSVAESGNKDI